MLHAARGVQHNFHAQAKASLTSTLLTFIDACSFLFCFVPRFVGRAALNVVDLKLSTGKRLWGRAHGAVKMQMLLARLRSSSENGWADACD
eukprot:SAG11_NODE_716_length_7614_cov_63.924837_2_plen_91_part_00